LRNKIENVEIFCKKLFINLLLLNMYKTTNYELKNAARDLCRKLRMSQTCAENLFWIQVRNRKFMDLKFRRQQPIFYEFNNRESFFIADFFCFEKRLVIEIDGVIHDYKLAEDNERSFILNNLDLNIIRIRNEEIELNLSKVLKDLAKEIEIL